MLRFRFLPHRRPSLALVVVGVIAVPLAWGGCFLDRGGNPTTSASGGSGSTSSSSSSSGGPGSSSSSSSGGVGGATSSSSVGGMGAGGMGTGGAGGGIGGMGGGGMPPLGATINCGQFHTCTSRPDGTGECWGEGDDGQLGNGVAADSDVPVGFVLGADQARDIQGGFYHTCALLMDGSVKCVGKNDKGQLGNGTTTESLTPVTVTGVTAKSIAAGDEYTCAVLMDDTVACWGDNLALQLGDTTAGDHSTAPIPVMGLPAGSTAIQVTAGKEHTCAVLSDGTAYCWGDNSHAQLGDGATSAASPPQQVLLTNIRHVDAGTSTTCAVTQDDKAYCWGSNESGDVGVGSMAVDIPMPTEIAGMHSVRSISAGWNHGCAVLTDDTVWCWGENGPLGTNGVGVATTGNILSPVQVMGIANADVISTGVDHSCASLKDGKIRCWGTHFSGQLGHGPNGGSPTPVTPVGY